MPHHHSPEASLLRQERAARKGFQAHRPDGHHWLLVPDHLRGRMKAILVSLVFHCEHDHLTERRSHFARSATLAAAPLVGSAATDVAMSAHRAANRAKHHWPPTLDSEPDQLQREDPWALAAGLRTAKAPAVSSHRSTSSSSPSGGAPLSDMVAASGASSSRASSPPSPPAGGALHGSAPSSSRSGGGDQWPGARGHGPVAASSSPAFATQADGGAASPPMLMFVGTAAELTEAARHLGASPWTGPVPSCSTSAPAHGEQVSVIGRCSCGSCQHRWLAAGWQCILSPFSVEPCDLSDSATIDVAEMGLVLDDAAAPSVELEVVDCRRPSSEVATQTTEVFPTTMHIRPPVREMVARLEPLCPAAGVAPGAEAGGVPVIDVEHNTGSPFPGSRWACLVARFLRAGRGCITADDVSESESDESDESGALGEALGALVPSGTPATIQDLTIGTSLVLMVDVLICGEPFDVLLPTGTRCQVVGVADGGRALLAAVPSANGPARVRQLYLPKSCLGNLQLLQ